MHGLAKESAGDRFGPYILRERIGAGGMAEIFLADRARPTGADDRVVIKRILPALSDDQQFVSMFVGEARLCSHLHHPNIVRVCDLGEFGAQYFIAMEYVDGRDLLKTLAACARKSIPFPTDLALYIVSEVLNALEYAHDLTDAEGRPLGIIHRDVSPSNVLLSFDGAVKLGDFGVAKASIRERTATGILKGKFGYMAPEQVTGVPIDCRADVFAVGILLYELLTGHRLFAGRTDLEVLERVRDAIIEPLPRRYRPQLSEELERIVLKALRCSPADRFQSAREFRDSIFRYTRARGAILSAKMLARFLGTLFSEGVPEREPSRSVVTEPGKVKATGLVRAPDDVAPRAPDAPRDDAEITRNASLGLLETTRGGVDVAQSSRKSAEKTDRAFEESIEMVTARRPSDELDVTSARAHPASRAHDPADFAAHEETLSLHDPDAGASREAHVETTVGVEHRRSSPQPEASAPEATRSVDMKLADFEETILLESSAQILKTEPRMAESVSSETAFLAQPDDSSLREFVASEKSIGASVILASHLLADEGQERVVQASPRREVASLAALAEETILGLPVASVDAAFDASEWQSGSDVADEAAVEAAVLNTQSFVQPNIESQASEEPNPFSVGSLGRPSRVAPARPVSAAARASLLRVGSTRASTSSPAALAHGGAKRRVATRSVLPAAEDLPKDDSSLDVGEMPNGADDRDQVPDRHASTTGHDALAAELLRATQGLHDTDDRGSDAPNTTASHPVFDASQLLATSEIASQGQDQAPSSLRSITNIRALDDSAAVELLGALSVLDQSSGDHAFDGLASSGDVSMEHTGLGVSLPDRPGGASPPIALNHYEDHRRNNPSASGGNRASDPAEPRRDVSQILAFDVVEEATESSVDVELDERKAAALKRAASGQQDERTSSGHMLPDALRLPAFDGGADRSELADSVQGTRDDRAMMKRDFESLERSVIPESSVSEETYAPPLGSRERITRTPPPTPPPPAPSTDDVPEHEPLPRRSDGLSGEFSNAPTPVAPETSEPFFAQPTGEARVLPASTHARLKALVEKQRLVREVHRPQGADAPASGATDDGSSSEAFGTLATVKAVDEHGERPHPTAAARAQSHARPSRTDGRNRPSVRPTPTASVFTNRMAWVAVAVAVVAVILVLGVALRSKQKARTPVPIAPIMGGTQSAKESAPADAKSPSRTSNDGRDDAPSQAIKAPSLAAPVAPEMPRVQTASITREPNPEPEKPKNLAGHDVEASPMKAAPTDATKVARTRVRPRALAPAKESMPPTRPSPRTSRQTGLDFYCADPVNIVIRPGPIEWAGSERKFIALEPGDYQMVIMRGEGPDKRVALRIVANSQPVAYNCDR